MIRKFCAKVIDRISASRLVSRPYVFLICEVMGLPARRFGWLAASQVYKIEGNSFKHVHHPDRSYVFRELFVERSYAPPDAIVQRLKELEQIRVLDLGGNVGMFGLFAAIEWPGCCVEAFEPDHASAAEYAALICENGWDDWSLHEEAAGASDGWIYFKSGLGIESTVSYEPTDTRVAVRDVLEKMSGSHLVKMDIEGGEWEILADPRFSECNFYGIVIEYHGKHCPSSSALNLVTKLLSDAHLTVVNVQHDEVSGVGLVWGLRD